MIEYRRGVEQRSARQAHNLEVAGSTPAPTNTLVIEVNYLGLTDHLSVENDQGTAEKVMGLNLQCPNVARHRP